MLVHLTAVFKAIHFLSILTFVAAGLFTGGLSVADSNPNPVDHEHCQYILTRQLGAEIFQRHAQAIKERRQTAEFQWHQIKASVAPGLLPVRSAFESALDWIRCELARVHKKTSYSVSTSPAVMTPRAAIIRSVVNANVADWWYLRRQLDRRPVQLKGLLSAWRMSQAIQRISARWRPWRDWAGEQMNSGATFYARRASPALPHSVNEKIADVSPVKADAYWQYYSDCDHWKVDFR